MSILEGFLLGILQGLTEFLPVSSSGHILLLQKFLSFEKTDIFLEVLVHAGSFLSIITFYFQDIKDSFKKPYFWYLVILANVMTALFVLPQKSYLKSLFYVDHFYFLSLAFLVTGLLLLMTKKFPGGVEKLNYKKALILGLVQGCAVVPGLSRSGLVISSALFLGLSRKDAGFFAFIVVLPALLGASFLELQNQDVVFSFPLLVAFFASYISGLIALKILVKFIESGKLYRFSLYLFTLSAILIFLESTS